MILPAVPDADQKNGGTAETGRQGKSDMLNVAEKATKASLLQKVGSEFIMASPDKRAAEWLAEQVGKSQDNITTVITDLTPALARVLLERNDGNRKTRESLAVSYARDMANGTWDLNGEPIIIAKNGMMNDGQHRCLGVVKADVSIPAVFVFGIERETRNTLDQGAIRSLADYLEMAGIAYSAQRATIAGYIWQHQNFNTVHYFAGRAKPTKTELRAIVDANRNIVDNIKFVDQKGVRVLGGVPFLAFIHWTLRKANKEAADKFMQALLDGVDLTARSPILYARNRMIAEHGKINRHLRAELIFKAWNAYRRGDTLKQLYLSGGQLPKVEK